MKRIRFDQVIVITLVVLSAVFFLLQQVIFHSIYKIEESEYLLFQDLIFLPLQIVFITFFLNRVLSTREKRERLEQINIVISAFFSETGSDAIRTLNTVVADMEAVRALIDMTPSWTEKSFDNAAKAVKSRNVHATLNVQTMEALKAALPDKNDIVKLFANPNLLEHDTFTDMLWALFHLSDEFSSRPDFTALPESDVAHLRGDFARAYGLLCCEWVVYMKHLKSRYPYLWSLAVRKNPFYEQTSVIVQPS